MSDRSQAILECIDAVNTTAGVFGPNVIYRSDALDRLYRLLGEEHARESRTTQAKSSELLEHATNE